MKPARPALALLLLTALTACQQSAGSRPSAAITAACRAEVDRVWAAQNRVDLSTRDTSATPFGNNYVSGITSSGLSQQFQRQTMQRDCVNSNTIGGPASDVPAAPTPLRPATTQP